MDKDTRLPWDENEEQWKLYTGGLLSSPLFVLIPRWLNELARVGLIGGKDGSPVDVPPEPGAVRVDAGGGQRVWIRPGAYSDEQGRPRAEVRESHARTDLAILGALAALKGGSSPPERLWADYERLWKGHEPMRESGFVPVPTESEKALMLAQALLEHRDPKKFGELSDEEHRERIVNIAKRIGTVEKALRDLAGDLEKGSLRSAVQDAARDVLAAEMHDLYGHTYQETARKLGMGEPRERDKIKSGHQGAEAAVKRGRKLLDQVHGGAGAWLRYAAKHRREASSQD